MAPRSDWRDLARELLGTIGDLVLAADVADYIRLRAVCRAWRELPDPCAQRVLDARYHPRQWIMLPEKAGTLHRRFLNLSTGESIHFDLPELIGQKIFRATTEGLLLLYDKDKDMGDLRLFNPITGLLTNLPYLDLLECEESQSFYQCYGGAALAVDLIAVLLAKATAVTKPNGICWMYLRRDDNTSVGEAVVHKAISVGGQVYDVSMHGVMRLEGEPEEPRPVMVAQLPPRTAFVWYQVEVYPVHMDGQLLLLEDCPARTPRFVMYLVNLETRRMVVRLNNIGQNALFIGDHRALAVSTKVFPSLMDGAIYRISDDGGARTSFFHFLDGTIGSTGRRYRDAQEVTVKSIADCLCGYVLGYGPDDRT